MKRHTLALFLLMALSAPLRGGESPEAPGDRLVGAYAATQGKDDYRVQVSRKADGTYRAQVTWVRDAMDPATGERRKDPKNPDKRLREVPCDEIVLIDGLRYNAGKGCWDGAKVYDPQRGVRANATVRMQADGTVLVKGTLMGLSETVVWKPIP